MDLEFTSKQTEIVYDALFEYKMKLKNIRAQHQNDPKKTFYCNEAIHEIENELLPMLESFIE
jgi:hypothetical protein